ncbi:MAG TPA: T9SS type A sorting domain-containing protein [Bacteroidia bacterium]|nr:T9SS type A sorting domain-containing protein [Bacteroidia bacterium]
MKKLILPAFLFCCMVAKSQNTFQKVYNYPADAQCFGAYQTSDNNYIMTGVADINGFKLFVSKQDCEGNPQWSKTYNASSTIGNISQRVIESSTGGYVMAGSAGSFNAYNIEVVRMDKNGNSTWKKMLTGNNDDVVNAIIQTSDYGYALAGKTNSFGQDAGTPYYDAYLAKIDSNGTFLWGKTFGTAQNYDEAFDVVETPDHGFALTGRYITNGAFHAMLLKTDSIGGFKYIKTYGDSNHSTNGFALINIPGGGFAITGSTTVLKNSFQDYPDELLIRTDQNGDTLWTRAWHGSNSDSFENASSLLMTPNGGFVMAVATASYPTIGFVPNKHMILQTDASGHILLARTYNNGGSHYPYLTKAVDGFGYLVSGFSNFYTPDFNPLLIRTDNLFQSGCNETDVTAMTIEQQPNLFVKTPICVLDSGGGVINATTESSFSFTITSLCENIVDSCTTTSVAENMNDQLNIRVFPNPATDYLKIHFSKIIPIAIGTELIIFNTDGKEVFHKNVPGKNFDGSIDVRNYQEGIYFITIKNAEGTLLSRKISIIRN